MLARAIVRRPGESLRRALTTAHLGTPDPAVALRQHHAYCEALARCGLHLTVLDEDPAFPDGCFVEDTAVVTDRVAIITRPGAASRRGEEVSIANVLGFHRPLVRVEAPATLDGGDVLEIEGHYLVGLSGRTNRRGAEALGAALEAAGHTWEPVVVPRGLHLKGLVTYAGQGAVVVSPHLASHPALADLRRVVVDPAEDLAANTLSVNGKLLVAKGFGRTRRALVKAGFDLLELALGEFHKVDGALTCLSLRF
jgi:dimethylargininase